MWNSLEQGKVVDIGDYEELIEGGGRYAGLWKVQQQSRRSAIFCFLNKPQSTQRAQRRE